ncbi:MAG: tyrosine-type recombinase/integrase [Planctomycetota bacterium]
MTWHETDPVTERFKFVAAVESGWEPGDAVTLHSLRHRFAMRLYRCTCDLYLVKQALGHRSIMSTTVARKSIETGWWARFARSARVSGEHSTRLTPDRADQTAGVGSSVGALRAGRSSTHGGPEPSLRPRFRWRRT